MTDDLIARLTLMGEVFANAIVRQREQERLLVAIAEIKALKDRLERENAYLKAAAQIRPSQGTRPKFCPPIDHSSSTIRPSVPLATTA